MKIVEKIKSVFNKEQDNAELVGKINRWYEYAKSARNKYDQRWYVYDQYNRGNHYIYYNKITHSLSNVSSIQPAQTGNRVRLAINKTHSIVRNVKNTVLKYKPKWDVIPLNGSEEASKAAKIGTKILDALWLKNNQEGKNMHTLIKEVVDSGLVIGQGYLQVYWDNDLDDVVLEFIDGFDIYRDPRATSIESSGFIFKTACKPLRYLKESKVYKNTKDLQGENILAASERKAMIIRGQLQEQESPDEDLATVILKECWHKEKGKVKVVGIAGEKLVRPSEETELTEYPIIVFHPETNSGQTYGESWIRDLMPLNKVGNRLESSVVEYNNSMVKGKYITDKGAGIRTITTQNGEIIEKNRGFEVTQMNLKPLPASINIQIQNIWKYMEDIGGRREASMGAVPSGIKSGKGLEALVAADLGNIVDVSDNLTLFLKEVGRRVLNLYAKHLTSPREFALSGQHGTEHIMIAGEGYTGEKEKVIHLKTIREVKVDLDSWLGVSKEAKQSKITMWRQMGVIDNRTFLDGIEFGDTEKIMDSLKEEARQVAEGNLLPPGMARTPAAVPGGQAGGRPPGGATSIPASE